jgi:hypothetical protein
MAERIAASVLPAEPVSRLPFLIASALLVEVAKK